MSIWELPKDHYNWESPVTKIFGDIHNEINRQDEEIWYTIEQAIGYKVDKEELIKALQYDRNQYEKGYNDGIKVTFVSELEKIKTELDEPMRDTTDSYGRGYACAMFKCLDILDNHIKELQGE